MTDKDIIFGFIQRYALIWDDIQLLEDSLESDRYKKDSILTSEDADVRMDEIIMISNKIKYKIKELEGMRSKEKEYLLSLENKFGIEYIENIFSQIKGIRIEHGIH